jgi:hypothetical protein
MKKLEFKKPVSESELQELIIDSLKATNFGGHWQFEHGYIYNKDLNNALSEKVIGYINLKDGLTQVAEFIVGPWLEDNFQEPMFGSIEFRPVYGREDNEKIFNDNIEAIYDKFIENYQNLLTE